MHLDLVKRLNRALSASRDVLFQAVHDPETAVLRNCLKNPSFDHDHMMVLLRRRDLTGEFLKSIHRHELVRASHALQRALARNPKTPTAVFLDLLPKLYLFELDDLCKQSWATPDQKIAAERLILQKLPNTNLGQKIALARKGSAPVVEAILNGGGPELVEACLNNPYLREVALLRFLNGKAATAETISMVARHQKWKRSPRLRAVILKNRQTPLIWFLLLLPKVPKTELLRLRDSRRLTVAQKALVEEEILVRARA
ncbi:MAG: hypothetical protein JRE63_04480 [Deltaproteobacteria bacterium]|jgi:hypothetical protein|nr:hypothetical protein [Deltaproteobacteria bacterium]